MTQRAATPDFDSYPVRHLPAGACPIPRGIEIRWDDGIVSRFHALWLRENAADPATTHPVTKEQSLQLVDIPETLTPAQVTVEESGAVRVHWNTGESSLFDPGWLRAHACETPDGHGTLPARRYWARDGMPDIPRFDGPAALEDDTMFQRWLTALHVEGVALLENLPATPDVIETVPARIGPVRPTNFGPVFDVKSMPDATSNAYTTMTLPLHADLATREYMPGLQFLHCLKNEAVGGNSLLADGFYLADRLRRVDPDAFETLTTVALEYGNKAKDTDYRFTSPMIRLDADGEIEEVRWTPWLRAPLVAPFETVDRVYHALRRLFALAEDPAHRIEIKLKPGDLLGFDNRRAIHGRTGFDPTTGGRHLRGCYVERDELYSRLRILARRQRAAADHRKL